MEISQVGKLIIGGKLLACLLFRGFVNGIFYLQAYQKLPPMCLTVDNFA